MARKRKGLTVSELAELIHSVTPEVLAAVPEITDAHARLSGMIAEVNSLWVERAVYESRKQAATKRIDQIVEDARKTATYVRRGLSLHFGADSEQLTAFRMKPFRGRKRANRAAKPAKPVVPAASDEPES